MTPASVTLQSSGLNTVATLSVPQPGDVPRIFTGTGRNTALAISVAVGKARKAGFAGRAWTCAEIGLKGTV